MPAAPKRPVGSPCLLLGSTILTMRSKWQLRPHDLLMN